MALMVELTVDKGCPVTFLVRYRDQWRTHVTQY
jgi:hypothetical protein